MFKAIQVLDLRFAESKEDSHLLKLTVYQPIDFLVCVLVFFILTRATTRSDRRKSEKRKY